MVLAAAPSHCSTGRLSGLMVAQAALTTEGQSRGRARRRRYHGAGDRRHAPPFLAADHAARENPYMNANVRNIALLVIIVLLLLVLYTGAVHIGPTGR